jgi:hypothetical protein
MYNMTIKIFIKITTIYEYERTNPGWAIREYKNLWGGELKQLCDTLLWFRETILMKINQNRLRIDMSIYRTPTLMDAFGTIENICMAHRAGSTIDRHDIYNKAKTIIANSNYNASQLKRINDSDYQQYIQNLLTAIDTMLQQNARNDVLRFLGFRRAGRPRLNYNSSSHYKLTRRRQPRRDYKLTRRRQPRRDYKLTRRRQPRRDYKLTRRRQPRRDYKLTRRRQPRRDYKLTRRRKSRHTMITR